MKTRGTVKFAGATDPGCVRPNNEDNFAIEQGLGLFIVADGMGGHNSGEVASDLATTTVRDFARKMLGGQKSLVPEGGTPGLSPRARQLEYFIRSANTLIYEKGRAFPKDAGMGTTIVAAIIDKNSLTVAHVGDSRLYLYRRGELLQLTVDHSLVSEQVQRGHISAEEAQHSNFQNILTRALGVEPEVAIDIADHPLVPGDLVLAASDGLTKMLNDAEIAAIMRAEEEPSRIVDALISRSRDAGGVDNVTVVVAKIPKTQGGRVRNLVERFLGG